MTPLAKLARTLLGALAVCAALLIGIGYAVGTRIPPSDGGTGLTAAALLASDGMGPDGRPGDAPDDPSVGRSADISARPTG